MTKWRELKKHPEGLFSPINLYLYFMAFLATVILLGLVSGLLSKIWAGLGDWFQLAYFLVFPVIFIVFPWTLLRTPLVIYRFATGKLEKLYLYEVVSLGITWAFFITGLIGDGFFHKGW